MLKQILVGLLIYFSIFPAKTDEMTTVRLDLNGIISNPNRPTLSASQYAAYLAEALSCKGPYCERAVLNELRDETFEDEVEEFFEMYLLYLATDKFGNQVEDLKKSMVRKLNGYRTLEKMLLKAGYEKAAKYVTDNLKETDENCIYFKKVKDRTEICLEASEIANNLCEKKCANGSVYDLIDAIKENSFKSVLLNAISEDNPEVYSAVENTCAVDLGESKNEINIGSKITQNDALCGILKSKKVLSALSGPSRSSFFSGGASISDYKCKFVKIAIEKHSPTWWGPDPQRFMFNYTIGPDNKLHRFDESDYQAIRKAVEAFNKKR